MHEVSTAYTQAHNHIHAHTNVHMHTHVHTCSLFTVHTSAFIQTHTHPHTHTCTHSPILDRCMPVNLHHFLISFPAYLKPTSVNVDNIVVTFNIWDTAGQERYDSLAPMHYMDVQAAIVMYDITDMVRRMLQAIQEG